MNFDFFLRLNRRTKPLKKLAGKLTKFINRENISKMKTSAMEIVSQQMGTKFIKGVKSEEKAKYAYLFMYF